MNHLIPRLLLLSACAVLVTSCASVPITGRSQLQLVSATEMAAMSEQQYDEMMRKARVSTDRRTAAQLERVGNRIARATESYLRANGVHMWFNWEFTLIDDDKQVNAWCMPGGKVAFYTGILPYTQNEDGMAVVMGHEVAHALARHGGERLSQALLAQLGGLALSEAMSAQPGKTAQVWKEAVGVGTQVGLLGYSRLHESEADQIGLILMAKAGYDPRTAISFWERMSNSGKQKPPELLSTHPSDARRIADIKRHLPAALKYYKE
jgi:predicted Zn-dependent protease